MKNKITTVIALAVFSLFTAGLQAGEAAKVTAVKFHKDTCGSCKKIDEYYSEVKAELADSPVLFVQFDFTDDATKSQSASAK